MTEEEKKKRLIAEAKRRSEADRRNLHRAITDLQKHVKVLGYHLHKIKNDDKNQNVATAKVAHKYIDDIVNFDLNRLERNLADRIAEENQKKHIDQLKKITASKKNSSDNIESFFRTREAIIKHAIRKGIQRQAKKEKDSD